jgi:uncharacterized protein involved in cysteine biosynthesis
MNLIGDALRAIGQLPERRFRSVFIRALGLTLLLLAAFFFGGGWLLSLFLPESITLPWIGEIGGVNLAIGFVSILGMFAASVFLMVPVAAALLGLFNDAIIDAVEARHYPSLPEAKPVSMGTALWDGAKLTLLVLVANGVALILYFTSTLLAPVIFWIVNGLILGREYFQAVALRRLPADQAKALRKRHFVQIWVAGFLMAVPLTIPLVNLVIPVLGVASFTHLFHRVNRRT